MYMLTKYRRGIKNKYRKGMPVTEMLIKDLKYSVQELKNYFGNNFRQRTILAYPHYPSSGSTIAKVAKALGYNLTNNPAAQSEAAIYWEYLTFREEYQLLEKLAATKKVVNLYSRDISKQFVDAALQKVFGYSTIIDPLTYHGPCVKKNDINAKHDGEVIACPVPVKEEGFIYQILIDNTADNNLVQDIRVPVLNGTLSFVYLKYRHISERFKNTTVKTDLVPIEAALSEKEIKLVNDFCQEIKLEYGELDVLRNKTDRRIYIVDVNNTPQGPPANTSKKDAAFAIQELANRFKQSYLG